MLVFKDTSLNNILDPYSVNRREVFDLVVLPSTSTALGCVRQLEGVGAALETLSSWLEENEPSNALENWLEEHPSQAIWLSLELVFSSAASAEDLKLSLKVNSQPFLPLPSLFTNSNLHCRTL